MQKVIYLDNNATTKMDNAVLNAMLPYLTEKYGNPSSLHYKGLEADNAVDEARQTVAKTINASPDEIYFTGSATEALNLGIAGFCHAKGKGHIITTQIEHSAIYNTVKRLETEGFEATYLKPDKQGFISSEQVTDAITPQTILTTIIHANHEIGTIQDIEKIGKVCAEKNVAFHTDACQSFTKTSLDVKKQHITMTALNGHKIHGPKGIGALYLKKDTTIKRLFEGGPQEKNMRPSTENVASIVGFAKASQMGVSEREKNVAKMTKIRDHLIDQLLEIPKSHLNGPTGEKRLCNNANITFDLVEGEGMLMLLSEQGICVSTGSACSSQSLTPSRILTSLGLSHAQAHGSLRFSISKYTNHDETTIAARITGRVVDQLRKLSPLR